MSQPLEELKYPIGKYDPSVEITNQQIQDWIAVIENFPQKLASAIEDLTDEQLKWAYRPNGWSIKQVVHHCADSHMNSFIRFKLALTEEQPTIKPYSEDRWAQQADYLDVSPDESLKIIEGVHARWTVLLKSLNDNQLNRTFMHPEHRKIFALEQVIGLYAWHCNHHLAHIEQAMNYNYRF
ncbi:YfiT family bacillithiol transferase [Namhaeicola litoreus]|uniref:YfiT family bacillithiol transferase n=1 Tax=Namhaeicola litoreus TaxID=1052145 RepID=A0ABW3XZA7_9FLAO